MSTPTRPSTSAPPARAPRTRVTEALSRAVTGLGTVVLAAVWVLIWGSLSVASAQSESLLKGVVLGTYTVAPVFVYAGWRLYRGVRSA